MNLRRFTALACSLVLLLALWPPVPVRADDTNTVYVRKHVSMLYDNSGSMSMDLEGAKNLKWCYASYAAQVFTALLNETDTLTITFMNSSVAKAMTLDLAGDRQAQVAKVLDATDTARGGTPLSSINTALQVLIDKGLLSDSQLGSQEVAAGEQYWLMLTTDGNFTDNNGQSCDLDTVESTLAQILEKYSSVHMVYFGIGTTGDTSSEAAIDFRDNAKLNAYPNFSAYFAEDQDQIVSTMQQMSNLISGRYDVNENVKVSGNTVTIRISGESSPIRNVALLAQQTNAQLLSATAEDGTPLQVTRSTSISYPSNKNYDEMPAGTLGGCTAMITSESGKIPTGTVTLTFSEAVSADCLSLMYEPAIYVALQIQRKDSTGTWENVKAGQIITAGDTLRLQYEICEDGSDTPLAPSRLPGESSAEFTCNGEALEPGQEFTVTSGSTTLSASVSLMDGAYRVSTTRTIQAVAPSDYIVTVSSALSMVDTELAVNTAQSIDFTVRLDGKAVDDESLAQFQVDPGSLQGTVSYPGNGVIRFTPQHSGCPTGDYTVSLYLGSTLKASQTLTVLTLSYGAAVSGDLELLDSELEDNTRSVTFRVTATLGSNTSPITDAESQQFRLEAKSQDGTVLGGESSFRDGTFTFTPNDPDTPAGTYTVALLFEDTVMAQATVTVVPDPVTYTAESSGDLALFNNALSGNTESVVFQVTSHRNTGDSPITQEEYALFRVEALSADGTALAGAVAFTEPGLIRFTPNDPSSAVGSYTVTLWYGDTALAQSGISILLYNAEYTVEAFVPDNTTVRRFGLLDNETAVSFVIYADGIPCSADQLSAMLQTMILTEQDPESWLMKLDVTVGDHNGTPAVIIRPTSFTDNRFLEFWSRTIAALGVVPTGDLVVSLTVDAAKGDSAFGTLQIVDTLGERIFYWVLLALVVLTVVLVVSVIVSNLRMPRIRPGYLVYYQTVCRDGEYYVTARDSRQIKTRFHFQVGFQPEVIHFQGLKFSAGTAGAGFQPGFHLLNQTFPRCNLHGPRSEVSTFYEAAPTIIAAQVLEALEVTYVGGIEDNVITPYLPSNPVEAPGYGEGAAEMISHTALMSPNGYLVKKGSTIEFWAYRSNNQQH